MNSNQSQPTFNLGRMIKKFCLSSFVVFTFVAYVVHQRFTNPDMALNPNPTIASMVQLQAISSAGTLSTATALPTFAAQPPTPITNAVAQAPALPTLTDIPTAIPTAIAANQGVYKNGTYTGPQVDAFYGIVEVQVNVQQGKIANVQFLQYPKDRRTSAYINSIAMPYLKQEAIQAQSANVNIVSGATLTSEGFMMSLDAALQSAKN
jgi:uncharacterized protein with FMN-binding domain